MDFSIILLLATSESLSELPGAQWGLVGVVILLLLGLLGWLLRHAYGTAIPAMHEAQSAALQKVVDGFSASTSAITTQHTSLMTKLIDTFTVEQEKARAVFRQETKDEREVCERRHQQNLLAFDKRQEDLLTALKESRHAIAGLAGTQSTLVALVEHVSGIKNRDQK